MHQFPCIHRSVIVVLRHATVTQPASAQSEEDCHKVLHDLNVGWLDGRMP